MIVFFGGMGIPEKVLLVGSVGQRILEIWYPDFFFIC